MYTGLLIDFVGHWSGYSLFPLFFSTFFYLLVLQWVYKKNSGWILHFMINPLKPFSIFYSYSGWFILVVLFLTLFQIFNNLRLSFFSTEKNTKYFFFNSNFSVEVSEEEWWNRKIVWRSLVANSNLCFSDRIKLRSKGLLVKNRRNSESMFAI